MLIIVTIIKGFQIDESPLFITVELLINILVISDFVCRVKLAGTKRFMRGGLWNIFDFIVVVTCSFMFIIILVSKAGIIKSMEEISEEILLIAWAVFQSFRMIIMAKK